MFHTPGFVVIPLDTKITALIPIRSELEGLRVAHPPCECGIRLCHFIYFYLLLQLCVVQIKHNRTHYLRENFPSLFRAQAPTNLQGEERYLKTIFIFLNTFTTGFPERSSKFFLGHRLLSKKPASGRIGPCLFPHEPQHRRHGLTGLSACSSPGSASHLAQQGMPVTSTGEATPSIACPTTEGQAGIRSMPRAFTARAQPLRRCPRREGRGRCLRRV